MARLVVTGVPELDARLRTLPDRIANRSVRRGLRAGAKLLAQEMRGRVPVGTGALKRSIRVRAAKRSRLGPGFVALTTGVRYAGVIEFGSVRRKIQADRYAKEAFQLAGPAARAEMERAILDEILRETENRA